MQSQLHPGENSEPSSILSSPEPMCQDSGPESNSLQLQGRYLVGGGKIVKEEQTLFARNFGGLFGLTRRPAQSIWLHLNTQNSCNSEVVTGGGGWGSSGY